MKKVLFLLLLLTSFFAISQTGDLSGIVQDKDYNNDPLPFVDVLIKGTTKGASSDFDGKYTIEGIKAGTYTVVFSFVGYKTIEVPDVIIKENNTTALNQALGASADALKAIIIQGTAKVKETERALILEQKEAVAITQTIGAQELAKKGVSNAESAVTKVAGITKSQGSKSVFVRGLGDRYNSTSLNGLPLPSDDPESKNISLDFFSANIISNIGINKTFSPNIYGDVGGANIDIKSKVVTKSSLSISSSTSINTRAVGQDFLRVGGANNFGNGIDEVNPINDSSLSTYNFGNPLQPSVDNFPINSSISLVAGGRTKLGNTTLNAFVVGSYKNDFKYKEGKNGSITADGSIVRDQNVKKYDFNTSQLLMGGLNLKYGGKNNIGLTHLYIHNNTQSVGEYTGIDSGVKDDGGVVFTRRQQVNDNDLFVNQLNGNQILTNRLELDYGGSFSFISANEPDRRTNTAFLNDDGEFVPAQGSAGFNHRFYSELQEDDYAAKAALTFNLNSDETNELTRTLKGGYNYRFTKRNFIFRQFNANIVRQNVIDLNNVDNTFNQSTLNNGNFTLVTDGGTRIDSRGRSISPLFPFFYLGDRNINSGYVDGVYQLNEKLTLNAGLRYDKIDQSVDYDTALVSSVNGTRPDDTAKLNKDYFLPSFNAKYQPTESAIFRLAGSISYTLPQLREVAPFVYEGINFTTIGNPKIDASKNYNLDVKGEYYFGETGLLTVTGFYKYIEFPINRVGSNSAANQITYVNVPEANVLGLEVEFKSDLFNTEINSGYNALSFGFNGSVLYSEQKQEDIPNDDITIRFTNSKDKLEGASPILLNSDLTYTVDREKLNFTSSVIFNYFSKRIFALGVAGSENIEESEIYTLDFVNKLNINKKIGISLSIKNILDPSIELTQEAKGNDVILNSYKKGIDISAGFSYKF